MKTDPDTNTQQLDKTVDLIKEVAVVIFALVGTWFSIINADVITLPWALLVLGAAVIIILFLPYKYAIIRDDDIGKITRGRVTSTIALGAPIWLLMTVVLVLNPPFVVDMFNALGDSESTVITRLFFLLFLAAIFLILPIYGWNWKRIRESLTPEKERSNLLREYDASYFGQIVTSMLVFDSAVLVAAGWYTRSNLSLSHGHFTQAIAILGYLLFFGLFSVRYMRERCSHQNACLVIEALIAVLVLAILDQDVISGVLLLFVLTIALGIDSRHEIAIEELETRKQEFENAFSSYIINRFSEEHPTAMKGLAGILLVSYLGAAFLLIFEVSGGILIPILFVVPFVMIGVIPLVWAYRTGNVPEST